MPFARSACVSSTAIARLRPVFQELLLLLGLCCFSGTDGRLFKPKDDVGAVPLLHVGADGAHDGVKTEFLGPHELALRWVYVHGRVFGLAESDIGRGARR